MRVYIHIDRKTQQLTEKSGVGRAVYHQQTALGTVGVRCVSSLEEADVVHINTVFPASYFFARKARKAGVPVVYHAHSTREDFRNSYLGSNLLSGLFKRWIVHCYNLGDVIVTPGEYSKALLQSYGIKKEIFAVTNGIDLSDYRRSRAAGEKFRKKYGFRESDKVIMSAGLLMRRKGVPDFTELARRMPWYRFIWFGESNLNFVGREVRDAVWNAPPNLIYAGYVPKRELQAALSGSDLFLFPSFEETEGIVVLEALAMRIPLLVRDIPVYDGWIEDGKTAYRARDIDDFERLARAMLEGELPDLTEEGYAAARRKSIENAGAGLLRAYKRAIEIAEQR